MGNKVIRITGQSSSSEDEKMELYKDISMVSERKTDQVVVKSGDSVVVRPRQMFHIAKDVNVDAVFNSLRNIFTWLQGERILNPDFGSRLRLYLYEGITNDNIEQIVAEIRGICVKWEPRVSIKSVRPVGTVDDVENNTVRLDILFTIPSLSDKQYKYTYTYSKAD